MQILTFEVAVNLFAIGPHHPHSLSVRVLTTVECILVKDIAGWVVSA